MRIVRAVLVLILAIAANRPAFAQSGFEWQPATPESQGMSSEKLAALRTELIGRKTRAWIVVRNDKIVEEWYAEGTTPEAKQGTASLAKAAIGGFSFAAAMTDGKVRLDDPIGRFVPQWASDPQKSKITFRHLGSHTSGLADAEENQLPHNKLTGWKGDFWLRKPPPDDPFTLARDQATILFEPGSELRYSNTGIAMLTYGVTAAIQGGPQKDVRSLLRERVMRPIGIADSEWSAGYGQTFDVGGLPLIAAWGGGTLTPRAAARQGRLVLREGDWEGQQVLSRESVAAMIGDSGLPGHCGVGWWTNRSGRYADIPKDTVWGAGAGDQLLVVIPSLKLVMVRNGESLGWDSKEGDVLERYHDGRAKGLFAPLVAAVTDSADTKQSSSSRRLSVESGGGQSITVTSTAVGGWKVVVDRSRGGVITDVQFPPGGGNVVSNDGMRFEGMCNTIYVCNKQTGQPDSGYVAKGALYSFGKLSRMEVRESAPERVVVEVEGVGGNQAQPQADVIRYLQRYSFLPDRVVCHGELEWVFDDVAADSHLELLQMQTMFAPGVVDGEMRVSDADTGPTELPQTNSKGGNFPNGIVYPLTVEVPLRAGRAFQIRSLTMPEDLTQARFYWNEFPRQIDGKRGFGFKAWEGYRGNGQVRFPKNGRIPYDYEIVFSRRSSAGG